MAVVDIGGRRSAAGTDRVYRPAARKSLLYEDVISMVEEIVASERLEPGDMLPTQAALAKRAGVSLITVRRALEELERVGAVRRHQGLGTFLARPRMVAAPARPGGLLATIDGADGPAEIRTEVLEIDRGTPSVDVAVALQIASTATVWKVRRRRLVDGRPLILETAMIPLVLAPELDRHAVELGGSLYELLAERYGLEDDYEDQLLEVVSPNAEERRLLKLTAHAQIVRLRGRSVDPTGKVFDCFEHVYPAADFIFSISGATSRQIVQGSDVRDWSVSPLAPASAGSAQVADPAAGQKRAR
ncbi:MAG TPA: GntR family transcriptional regulator [Acidimicrobiales bacterium]|nr:GntR family transcriptional regulator [Acidimicrobiales bacterium]